MVNTKQIISNNHKIAIFSIISILGVVYWLVFDFLRQIEYDTSSFVGASRLIFGLKGGYIAQSRLSKPLVLILPGLAEYLWGINPKYIFLLQNLFSYIILGFVIYKIIYLIFENKRLSLLGVIIYFMSQPFAVFSLFYLADTVGWLFGCYTIYLTLKHFLNTTPNQVKIMLISTFAGLGMLAKESAAIGIIFLIVFIWLSSDKKLHKLRNTLLSVIFFLIPFLISNMITQSLYGVSVFQRIFYQQNKVGFIFYNADNIQQLYRIFDVYWLLIIIGLWGFLKSIIKKQVDKLQLTFILTALLTLIALPIYPFIVDRILFMIAPTLLFLAILGSIKFERFKLFLVVAGGFINISITWLIYQFNIHGALLFGVLIYALLLITTYAFLKIVNKNNGVKNIPTVNLN